MARPVGSTETPANLLKQDVKDTIKLNRQLRDAIQQQLDSLKALAKNPDLSLKDRLAIIQLLAAAVGATSKPLGDVAKHIIEKGEEQASGADVEDLMAKFLQ